MPSTFPVVENRPEDDHNFLGKALFDDLGHLDKLSEMAGSRRLSDFVYVDPEDLKEILGDTGLDLPDQDEWHSSQEGLEAVEALLDLVVVEEGEKENVELVKDLDALKQILMAAVESGSRWRLQQDL